MSRRIPSRRSSRLALGRARQPSLWSRLFEGLSPAADPLTDQDPEQVRARLRFPPHRA